MIEPVSDDLTMPINPRLRANRLMMISGALPSVAFSKAPRVGPRYSASASVASPIKPASGTIASADTANTRIGLNFKKSSTIATGIEDQQPVQVQGTTPSSLKDEPSSEPRHCISGSHVRRHKRPGHEPGSNHSDSTRHSIAMFDCDFTNLELCFEVAAKRSRGIVAMCLYLAVGPDPVAEHAVMNAGTLFAISVFG